MVGIKHFAGTEDYAKIFNSILKFYAAPTDPALANYDQSLVTISGDTKLDLVLNELKMKSLQCLKIILNYLLKKKPKELYGLSNVYLQNTLTLVHLLTNTFILLPTHPHFEQLMMNGHINGIVINGVDIICMTIPEKDFN